LAIAPTPQAPTPLFSIPPLGIQRAADSGRQRVFLAQAGGRAITNLNLGWTSFSSAPTVVLWKRIGCKASRPLSVRCHGGAL